MRIISGTHKGKRLTAPKNLPVRPTTDFAKESLFNILNHRVDFQEIKILDLFAGTGNISFEFASRGTQDVIAVDAHYGCVSYIRKIATELSFPITTIKSDVFKYIQRERSPVDVIFADPPYNFEFSQFDDLVRNSFQNNLLLSDGIFIIEHAKHTDLSEIDGYQESRRYGGSVFSFFVTN